jgi:hypothetical protein
MAVLKDVGEQLHNQLKEKLALIPQDHITVLKTAEIAIVICRDHLHTLKATVIDHRFENVEEEIYFFKHIKPLFYSELIYYVEVYSFHCDRPTGSDEVQREYILNELASITHFYDKNHSFYHYYRSESTYLDDKYFTRNNHDVHLSLDSYFFEPDPLFNTSHDLKLSVILAYDRLELYLKQQLYNPVKDLAAPAQDANLISPLRWSDNKVALVELIYALHTCGVFNEGHADLKMIATYFEHAFKVDLGNYYHKWIEIRMRKTGQTKFLGTLKARLQQLIEEMI